MRIGIFSDVHANLEALQAALTFFLKQKVSHYFFIGDLIGYGANPNECIEIVKHLDLVAVAGNHDYGAVEKIDISNFNDAAKNAILWTEKILSNESKNSLELLVLQQQKQNCLLVHASPHNPEIWEYIVNLRQAQDEFEFFKEQICFIGHSHTPFIVEKDLPNNDCKYVSDQKIKIKNNFKYLINAGSVGQPRDGDARACVSILDTKTNSFEFYRLEYNIKLAQEKIIKAGLPPVLAERLAKGK
jgi:predicted phosphodiesterase